MNTSDTKNQYDTGYKDILRTIGAQLKQRQKTIAKRVAFVSLPLILTVTPLIYFGELTKDSNLPSEQKTILLLVLLCLVAFVGLPWAIVMGHIFKIERIIWIDSFFDGLQLSNRESWRLAKKLFWPSIIVDLLVFLRYWLPVITLSIGSIGFYFVLAAQKFISFDWLVFVLLVISILVLLTIYAYFVKIHLRYLLFLLVDTYQTQSFSYRSLFSEMRRLNRTSKSDDFTKMLVSILGTEATEKAVNTVIGALGGAITSHMGGAGKTAGQAAALYANEVVTVNKSYAQTVTFYVFYKVARNVVYGNAQVVNDKLYSSSKSTGSVAQYQNHNHRKDEV